jgi:hypothetical protein
LGAVALGLSVGPVSAEPVVFDVPAQAGDAALLALAAQARLEVLFPFDELHRKTTPAVKGQLEPDEALRRLLAGTGYAARPTGTGKFAVARAGRPASPVSGRVLGPDGTGARRVRIALPAAHLTALTDDRGDYVFPAVPAGTYDLIASAAGLVTLQLSPVRVAPDAPLVVPTLTLQNGAEPTRLAPFFVEGSAETRAPPSGRPVTFPPRTAVGNLDLARTQSDAIPFTILDREHLRRSGVVNLNEFLQRELIDSDATGSPPEQNGLLSSFVVGSSNLGLRGFSGADETIILVNGRRLPEVLTSGSNSEPRMPDVNFIPSASCSRSRSCRSPPPRCTTATPSAA